VSRKTVHQWLSRYEADGLEGLADRSHRPRSSPLQMPAVVGRQMTRTRPLEIQVESRADADWSF